MVNVAQQIGGSIGLAVFSSLSATAITSYLDDHAANPAALVDAALSGYHFVFWIAAALFLVGAVLAGCSSAAARCPSPRTRPLSSHTDRRWEIR
jgi:hypothetical protein